MSGEQHIYVVASGHWSDADNSTERWQFGVRLALVFGSVDDIGTFPNNWTVEPAATTTTDSGWTIENEFLVNGPGITDWNPGDWMVSDLIPAATALLSANCVGSHSILDTLKISPINTSGHVVDLRTCHAENSTGVAGTAGGDALPLQNTVAISTRTPRIGAKGRGRFYLPGVSTNLIDHDGALTSTAIANYGVAASAFLTALVTDGGGSGTYHTAPVVSGPPYTDYGRITQIRVGNRVDTQRRRRRQLVETYTDTDL